MTLETPAGPAMRFHRDDVEKAAESTVKVEWNQTVFGVRKAAAMEVWKTTDLFLAVE